MYAVRAGVRVKSDFLKGGTGTGSTARDAERGRQCEEPAGSPGEGVSAHGVILNPLCPSLSRNQNSAEERTRAR